tara:strand:- start:1532 stop:1924 length:393 start_codon:yes stop_codon:yes gene_type:complete
MIWQYVKRVLNARYFNDSLRDAPVFEEDFEGDQLGDCETWEEYDMVHVTIRRGLSVREALGVLLHEMCHQSVYEQYGAEVEAHGPEWIAEMVRVGFSDPDEHSIDFFSNEEADEIVQVSQEDERWRYELW